MVEGLDQSPLATGKLEITTAEAESYCRSEGPSLQQHRALIGGCEPVLPKIAIECRLLEPRAALLERLLGSLVTPEQGPQFGEQGFKTLTGLFRL